MNEKQYNNFKAISKKICNGDEKSEDLMHDVLLQLDKNKVYNTLSEKDQVFFFIRTISNQYRSNNSLFKRTYKKYVFEEYVPKYHEKVEDEPYQEKLSLIHI